MKQGDVVELISIDNIDTEDVNWILDEIKYYKKPINIGDRFEIDEINEDTIKLVNLMYLHPIERFKLISE